MEDYFFETIQSEKKDVVYVLIIYDIVDTKKRTKLAKFLEGYGFRVQKSAFEALIPEKLYQQLVAKLPMYLDKNKDSIRVYKFRGYGEVYMFGVNEKVKMEDVIII